MIQFNLLPDVKLEYLKAHRVRRLVTTVAVVACAVSVTILVVLLSYDGLQRKHLNNLKNDISSETQKLQNEPQINKILTVQNQLQSLTKLHDNKPAASQLFIYLNQVTPAAVSINSFNIDFTQQTATITGTADSLSSIDTYVDTLKFTTYTSVSKTTKQMAFSKVVLSSFGLNGSAQDPSQAASYSITLSYDPTIFEITEKAKLSVPKLTTTRPDLEQPTDLFKAAPPAPSSPTTNGSSSSSGANDNSTTTGGGQ